MTRQEETEALARALPLYTAAGQEAQVAIFARRLRITPAAAWARIQTAADNARAREIVAKEATEERALFGTPAAPGCLF